MLNPIECIWSKVKCYTKTHLRVPQVVAPGVIEQRLVYLEEIIDAAKDTITGGDCARAHHHTSCCRFSKGRHISRPLNMIVFC
jgi:hypothetical protein